MKRAHSRGFDPTTNPRPKLCNGDGTLLNQSERTLVREPNYTNYIRKLHTGAKYRSTEIDCNHLHKVNRPVKYNYTACA
jgi:hypothetical protein